MSGKFSAADWSPMADVCRESLIHILSGPTQSYETTCQDLSGRARASSLDRFQWAMPSLIRRC